MNSLFSEVLMNSLFSEYRFLANTFNVRENTLHVKENTFHVRENTFYREHILLRTHSIENTFYQFSKRPPRN